MACRRNRTRSNTPMTMTSRKRQPAHRGVPRLAFLLNCARTSQQTTNASHSSRTSRGGCSIRAASVAEVVELQRQIDLRAAQQPDGLLQVVALLGCDPDFVALDA